MPAPGPQTNPEGAADYCPPADGSQGFLIPKPRVLDHGSSWTLESYAQLSRLLYTDPGWPGKLGPQSQWPSSTRPDKLGTGQVQKWSDFERSGTG